MAADTEYEEKALDWIEEITGKKKKKKKKSNNSIVL
jgi:hypothetical protein